MKQVVATIFHRQGSHLWFGLALAAVFTVMTVLQLFTFEDMPGALSMLLPNDWAFDANILMSLIVTIEVFAIPYFLPIALSPLARMCTTVFALATPLIWAGLNVYAVMANQMANAAFLSPKVPLDASIMSVSGMVVLCAAVLGLMVVDRRSHT